MVAPARPISPSVTVSHLLDRCHGELPRALQYANHKLWHGCRGVARRMAHWKSVLDTLRTLEMIVDVRGPVTVEIKSDCFFETKEEEASALR